MDILHLLEILKLRYDKNMTLERLVTVLDNARRILNIEIDELVSFFSIPLKNYRFVRPSALNGPIDLKSEFIEDCDRRKILNLDIPKSRGLRICNMGMKVLESDRTEKLEGRTERLQFINPDIIAVQHCEKIWLPQSSKLVIDYTEEKNAVYGTRSFSSRRNIGDFAYFIEFDNIVIGSIDLNVSSESFASDRYKIQQILSYIKPMIWSPMILTGCFGDKASTNVAEFIKLGFIDVMGEELRYTTYKGTKEDYILIRGFGKDCIIGTWVYYDSSTEHLPLITDLSIPEKN